MRIPYLAECLISAEGRAYQKYTSPMYDDMTWMYRDMNGKAFYVTINRYNYDIHTKFLDIYQAQATRQSAESPRLLQTQ